MNMEADKLLKLVCPTYKQYLKSLLLCFFIYVLFKVHNGLIIALAITMIINLLSSMIEVTRWSKAIMNNEYDLVYGHVTNFLYSAYLTDVSSDYALAMIKNINVGDTVMLLVFKDEYLIVKKVI